MSLRNGILSEKLGKVTHTDIAYPDGLEPVKGFRKNLTTFAIQNSFDHYYPHDHTRAVKYGQQMAVMAIDDITAMVGWNLRFRAAIANAQEYTEPVIDKQLEPLARAAEVLLALDKITDSFWVDQGKGVSAELGHVVQLGDWSGAALDGLMKDLPECQKLEDAGFGFDKIYDEDTFVRYKLRHGETGLPNLDPYIGFHRLRPVADLTGPSGLRYELVKRSGFPINPEELSSVESQQVRDVLAIYGTGKSNNSKHKATQLGSKIVEPAIKDKNSRSQPRVMPTTSQYFAIRRRC